MGSSDDRHASRDLGRLLGWLLGETTWLHAALVAVLLLVAWAVSHAIGGAGTVPPHVFYVPVLVAAARFGWIGAATTGVVAGILAGPLLPQHVASGSPQMTTDWVSRLGFFVAIGMTAAAVFDGTRRVERRLRENRRILATMLANLPGMAYRGEPVPERTMEFVSEGSRQLTGHAAKELLDDRRAVRYGDLIHPDDRNAAWQAVKAAVEADRPFQVTYRLVRPDGGVRWARDQGRLVVSRGNGSGRIEGLVTDVTREREAERQREKGVRTLTRLLKERRRLLELLISAQEDERRRIAGELHDDSLQVLSALGIRLGVLSRDLKDQAQLERLRGLESTLTESMKRLRRLMFDLYPPQLDREGLVPALRLVLEELRSDLGITYRVVDELAAEPTAEIRSVAFRMAQEALVNVRKHANATRVDLTVASEEGGIRIGVLDDGVGFSMVDTKIGLPGHLGLPTIHERAELMGGDCRIESSPGRGTVVEFWLPEAAGLRAEAAATR